MTRVHIILPKRLVEQIDALVGSRRRSEYVAQVVEDRIRQERLLSLASSAAGTIKDGEIPEWDTAESAAAWIAAQRPRDEPWDALTPET